ncbi:MAG: MucB/RseB C-terminal domain-containing protein [Gammaproteobacteria bacterium]
MRLLVAGAACALLLSAPLLRAEEGADAARKWLEKMSTAARTLNYEGTFVYLHDGQMVSMRIIHGAGPRGEQERLIVLNGVGREMMRDPRVVTSIQYQHSAEVVARSRPRKPFPSGLFSNNAALGKYYIFSLDGEGRVADRLARVVRVTPRDTYRYGYRLWIDQASGLLLKYELINAQDAPLEQLMFTTLDLHPAPPAGLPDPDEGAEIHNAPARADEAQGRTSVAGGGMPGATADPAPDKVWRITRMPEGFAQTEQGTRILTTHAAPMEHIILSDGLAAVSVFIEKLNGAPGFKGSRKMGAVRAYGSVMQDHQITVVGGVPEQTVRMIAESVRMEQAP